MGGFFCEPTQVEICQASTSGKWLFERFTPPIFVGPHAHRCLFLSSSSPPFHPSLPSPRRFDVSASFFLSRPFLGSSLCPPPFFFLLKLSSSSSMSLLIIFHLLSPFVSPLQSPSSIVTTRQSAPRPLLQPPSWRTPPPPSPSCSFVSGAFLFLEGARHLLLQESLHYLFSPPSPSQSSGSFFEAQPIPSFLRCLKPLPFFPVFQHAPPVLQSLVRPFSNPSPFFCFEVGGPTAPPSKGPLP